MGLITNKGYIGYGKQTVKGTPVVPAVFAKYLEENFNTESEQSAIREGGDDELVVTQIKNLHRERTGVKVIARPNIAAYLFAYLLVTVVN